jgi:hypothetical protein
MYHERRRKGMSAETAPRRQGRRRAGVGSVLLVIGVFGAAAAGPVSAATPTVIRVTNNQFHTVQHFDFDPACGPWSVGVTETSDGNEHLVIVDDGTHLTVHYGETFHISAIPDDSSVPPSTRQGTDSQVFVLLRNGDSVYHESFHDFGLAAWDLDAKIRFITTLTTKDGEVHVDHEILNDMPPPGC